MTVTRYFALCMRQESWWLAAVVASPSRSMRPIHLAIIRVALRRKGVRT